MNVERMFVRISWNLRGDGGSKGKQVVEVDSIIEAELVGERRWW